MPIEPSDTDVDALLRCRLPMPADDSAAAIILVDKAEYLMQLRDNKTTIYYPGHWGLFGGAVDPGESPEQAVLRELKEELGLIPREIRYVTEFNFDLSFVGERKIYRKYFEVHVTSAEVARLSLAEGRAMASFKPGELFGRRLTPYDSFVLWLHYLKSADGAANGKVGLV